jgi:hypothetical protein
LGFFLADMLDRSRADKMVERKEKKELAEKKE